MKQDLSDDNDLPAGSRLARLRQLRQRRWVAWSMDLAMLALIFFGVSAFQARHLLGGHDPAPPFTLAHHAQPGTTSLEQLSGKPTVLVFWAPWCGVCGAESSTISALQEAVGEDVDVVSVALDYGDESKVAQYVERYGVDYPVLLGDDELMRAYRVQAFPTVYILDAEGRIAWSLVGYTSGFGLRWRLWLT